MVVVEDIREMGKTPETPNPNPEREMGKREKKPRNQRGKWEKEENGKRKREGEPNGVREEKKGRRTQRSDHAPSLIEKQRRPLRDGLSP